MRLKTTQDNAVAVAFYAKNGLSMVRKEAGKKRELLVFEKNSRVPELVNQTMADPARSRRRLGH